MNSVPAGRPPFRADHIGSLLRPKKLREAFRRTRRRRDRRGRISRCTRRGDPRRRPAPGGLRAAGRHRRRVSARLLLGEVRAADRGLVVKEAVFTFHDEHGHESTFTAPYVEGKVSRRAPITADEIGSCRSSPRRAQGRPCRRRRRCTSTASPTGATRGLRRPGRVLRRPRQDLPAGDRRARGRPAASYVQLDEVALAILCDPGRTRQGRRPPAATPTAGRPVRRGDQRGGEEAPGRRDRRRARLPRQLQGHVPVRRRLRLGRASASSGAPTSTTSCSSSTRRAPAASTPLRFVPKTRAWCSDWSARRRPQLESIGRAEAPHRGGGQVRRPGSAGDQSAVRVREHDGRQPGDRGRRARQAAAVRGGGDRRSGGRAAQVR